MLICEAAKTCKGKVSLLLHDRENGVGYLTTSVRLRTQMMEMQQLFALQDLLSLPLHAQMDNV